MVIAYSLLKVNNKIQVYWNCLFLSNKCCSIIKNVHIRWAFLLIKKLKGQESCYGLEQLAQLIFKQMVKIIEVRNKGIQK